MRDPKELPPAVEYLKIRQMPDEVREAAVRRSDATRAIYARRDMNSVERQRALSDWHRHDKTLAARPHRLGGTA